MRKIFSIVLLFAVMITVSTGCLKDKGFDDHTYGINSPETSPAGIGLPLAVTPQTFGLNLTSSTQTVSDILVANLLAGKAAGGDIKVNLVMKPSLIADYNSKNSASVLELSSTLYSLTAMTITIKAGQTLGDVKINIPSTLTLDATKTYGLGFSISSVDAGYTIASNMKDLLILFNIKNKYDGIYQLRGYHNRSSPDYTLPYNVKVQMITTGPASVAMWYLPPGPDTYAHPINGSTGSYYGSLSPDVTFDLSTNIATGIQNYSAYGTTPPMNLVTGTGINNVCTFTSSGKPDKMYLLWRYNANDLRRFYDTLTYIGPR